MKKIFVTLLILVMSVCIVMPTFATEFSDLASDHWAHDNIIKLVDDGVVTGYPDGTYRPENTITRGEFLKLIMITLYGGDEYFDTVREAYGLLVASHWALPYAMEAANSGYLMDGTSANNLDAEITRKEMVTILAKICVKNHLENDQKTDKIEFTDIGDLDEETKLYIDFVTTNKLITGYPDGTFGPDKYMTRAEVAVILNRYLY